MNRRGRIIGSYGNLQSNQLIICFAGVHGNETSGIEALKNIFKVLKEKSLEFNGFLIGLKGNITAIAQNRRYLDVDLNRVWEEDLEKNITKNKNLSEYQEAADLLEVIHEIPLGNFKQKFFLDLHGTSADNGIFAIVTQKSSTNKAIKDLTIPIILGLHEELKNTTVPYFENLGFNSAAVEGGKIGDKKTIANHEKVVWEILRDLHVIQEEEIPQEIREDHFLVNFSKPLPDVLSLAYCHKIIPEDNFKMKPGFKNFDFVKEGDLLATDINGNIRAKTDGYVLMPLYQTEGSDGFFIVTSKDS